jgi:soluble lytic murein transglycosylase-like protein
MDKIIIIVSLLVLPTGLFASTYQKLNHVRDDLPEQRHKELAQAVNTYSNTYNVDSALIIAFIDVETDGRNTCGDQNLNEPACGYMQVQPSTFEHVMGYHTTPKRMVYDWKTSLQAGVQYLSDLQKQYGWIEAIGVYNGGPEYGSMNWQYIRKILNDYKELKQYE